MSDTVTLDEALDDACRQLQSDFPKALLGIGNVAIFRCTDNKGVIVSVFPLACLPAFEKWMREQSSLIVEIERSIGDES